MITFNEKLYSSAIARVIRGANRLIGRSKIKSSRAAVKANDALLNTTVKGFDKVSTAGKVVASAGKAVASAGKAVDKGVKKAVKKAATDVLARSSGTSKVHAMRKVIAADNRVKKEVSDAIKGSIKYGKDFAKEASYDPGRRIVKMGKEFIEKPVSTTMRASSIALPGGSVIRVAAEPISKLETKVLANSKYGDVSKKVINGLRKKHVDEYLTEGVNSALKFGGII